MTDAYDIYIYHEGYLRTSSEAFSLDLRSTKTAASGAGASAQMVHLTNYCMQKHSKNLGKFEEGNTLKYDDLQVLCQRDGDGGSLLEEGGEKTRNGSRVFRFVQISTNGNAPRGVCRSTSLSSFPMRALASATTFCHASRSSYWTRCCRVRQRLLASAGVVVDV